MSNHAQSQQVPIKTLNWEPFSNSLPIDITEAHQDVTVDHELDGYAHSHRAVYARKSTDFVQGSTATTSVAMNGSVERNGASLARAAENIAQWKIYLPEECIRAMMNAGWHWST